MNQTFGSFVRQKRMEQGLSLRGLAARLDLSPVYMSNIETGRKPAPARENLDNPYCFSVGGVGVKIEFAEGGPSLQETLTAFLIRQKSGL